MLKSEWDFKKIIKIILIMVIFILFNYKFFGNLYEFRII